MFDSVTQERAGEAAANATNGANLRHFSSISIEMKPG